MSDLPVPVATGAVAPTTLPPCLPPLAERLAYAGLLPFVAGAIMGWLVYPYPEPHAFIVEAMAGYAAIIISFLGGIHWGLAMKSGSQEPHAWRWAVTPSLVAWLGVAMPAHAGLVVLGTMLIVCYQMDRKLYHQAHLAHWLTLRFRLTAVAAFCCYLTAANA